MRLRLLVALAVVAVVLSSVLTAVAGNSHNTSGTTGTHSSGSHTNNPVHLWVWVGSPGAVAVESGGRFHDNCGTTSCGSALGGDWALDVGLNGGSANRLYLGYGGWGSGGVTPDNNRTITLEARAVTTGNFRSPARSACQWQQLEILASYWDTGGVFYQDRVVGYVWFAHLTSWWLGDGARLFANASLTNPYGTGTVRTVSGIRIADVYDGKDTLANSCSSGSHSHVEVFSTHAWGLEYEWHSASGPDGYNALAGISNHVHFTYPFTADSVSAGQNVGAVGGGTTNFWMRDNPVRSEY